MLGFPVERRVAAGYWVVWMREDLYKPLYEKSIFTPPPWKEAEKRVKYGKKEKSTRCFNG